jgi:hypothetical protein
MKMSFSEFTLQKLGEFEVVRAISIGFFMRKLFAECVESVHGCQPFSLLLV